MTKATSEEKRKRRNLCLFDTRCFSKKMKKRVMLDCKNV